MKTRTVKRSEIGETLRFDGSYHNAEGNIYYRTVKKHSQGKLSDYCIRIFTSGRNRRIYTDSDYGFPFLSNTDASSANPFMSCKYSSKKIGFDKESVLLPGMILTGRVGAIGQTVFVPNHWVKSNTMGSDNIIRIQTKENEPNGFLYAYLASSIGKLILLKHSTGGVQPFITDSMVGEIPVPKIDSDLVKKVDIMIKESARIREEAAELLYKAKDFFDSRIKLTYESKKHNSISIKSILNSQNERFEANYYTSKGAEYEKMIKENFNHRILKDFFYDISRPDIFKRNYVSENKGVMFLGSTEIFLATPQSSKFVSKKNSKLDSLILKEGWLLVPRSGTIGDCVYANSIHEGKLASEHVIRLKAKTVEDGAYVYAFLSSNAGKLLLQKAQFGSVIQTIEPPMLEIIPVPMFHDAFKTIANFEVEGNKKLGKAGKLELEAISLVESEIEKWNKE